MKVSRPHMSLLLAAFLAVLSVAAEAFPVAFSPDVNGTTGKVTAKIPLEKLGSVTIPRGRLKIRGGWAEVSTVQEFQFDHNVVLSGPVLNSQQKVSNGNLEISGLAYFSDGDWLPYLSTAAFEETVKTRGEELTGRILSMDRQEAVILLASGQKKEIPVAQIRDIHSPRAFRFVITGAAPEGVPPGQPYETEASRLSMLQTARQFRVTALRTDLRRRGDGDLTTGQLVAIGSLMSAIEIGQMVPFLVVPLQYNRLHQNAFQREFDIQTNPFAIVSPFGIPSNQIPPPPGIFPSNGYVGPPGR